MANQKLYHIAPEGPEDRYTITIEEGGCKTELMETVSDHEGGTVSWPRPFEELEEALNFLYTLAEQQGEYIKLVSGTSNWGGQLFITFEVQNG